MGSDARLDLEVVIDGTETAANGLDRVSKSGRSVGSGVGSGANSAQGAVDGLEGAVGTLVKTSVAASRAQNALAQAMSGNIVGAATSAAGSVRSLLSALSGNVWTAAVGVVAAAGTALINYLERMNEKARATREQLQLIRDMGASAGRSFAAIEGTDPISVARKDSAAAMRPDQAILGYNVSKKLYEDAKKEYLDLLEQQRKWVSEKSGRTADSFPLKYLMEPALAFALDQGEAMNIWKPRINELNKAKGVWGGWVENSKASSGAAGTNGGNLSDLGERQAALDREKQLDTIADPLLRLKAEQKMLMADRSKAAGADYESARKRLEIDERLFAISKEMTKESRRRMDAEAKASAEKKDEADRQAAATKRQAQAEKEAEAQKAAARAALNGTERAEAFSAVDAPDGFEVSRSGRKRRTLAGGRAAQWFKQRNHDIATASGGAFVTTEMGRPMMETAGRHKGVDRTNALLEQIKERLA